MNKAIGYVRVSTDEQDLRAQKDAIRSAAERLGLPSPSFFKDVGISGAASIDKRPGLMDAIADIKEGAVLLVAKRDRLARDLMTLMLIEHMVSKKGGTIVSAAGEGTNPDEAEDPAAFLLRRIVDVFAEYERLVIKFRTSAALRAKRRRGEKCGGSAPFGWDEVGDRWERNHHESTTVNKMTRLQDGGASLSSIAATLNSEGITAKQGGRWSHSQVARAIGYYNQGEDQ